MNNSPHKDDIVSFRFKYRGEWRWVDNITLEDDFKSFVGREIRKRGRYSWQIKRYSITEVQSNLIRVEPLFEADYYKKLKEKAMSANKRAGGQAFGAA